MTRRLIRFTALLATLATGLWAQRSTFRQYGPEQGLTNLVVDRLLEDKRGNLWIGTDNGLFRYDGNAFRAYTRDDGLTGQFEFNLGESPDGELWVTSAGGVARFDRGRFTRIETGLTDLMPIAPAFDNAGYVYLVSGAGLMRSKRTASGAHSFRLIVPGKVTALYAHDGQVWAAADGGLLRITDGQKSVVGSPAGLPSERWTGIAEDSQGNLWVRSSRRLFKLPLGGKRFEDMSAGVPVCSSSTCDLRSDLHGGVLAPTDTGLSIVGRGRPVAVDAAHGLPAQWVRSALITRDGTLWLGTYGGGLIRRLGRGEWMSWQQTDGLAHNTVWAIRSDAAGQTWVGSNGGLSMLDQAGKVKRSWTRRDGLTGDRVESILVLPSGGVLAGTRPAGVTRIGSDGAVLERFGPEQGLSRGTVLGMGFDGDNRLWLVTSAKCLRSIQPVKNWTAIRFEPVNIPGVTKAKFHGLSVAASGAILVGTGDGLARFSGGQWRLYTKADGLLSNDVMTPQENDGALWVRYYDSPGLSRIGIAGGGTGIEHFNKAGGMPSDAVYGIAFDTRNRLWVSSDNGVAVRINGRWRNLSAAEGLISSDCDDDALYADARGVWVGTSNGLSRYSERYPLTEPSPPLVLSSIESALGSHPVNEELQLDYGHRSLRIRFGTLQFFREGALNFRYRLHGEDAGWTETRETSVGYGGLGPGHHRFEVMAAGTDGLWSGNPASFDFVIETPWWQSWWFRSFACLGVVALAAAGFRIRHRILLSQKKALEALVAEQTAELRESYGKLERIAYLDSLTQLANRRMFNEEFERRLARAAHHGETFALILIDLDRFKPINDTFGHDTGDAVLVETGRRIRQAVRDDDCVARLGGDEFGLILTQIDQVSRAESVCARIAESIREPYTFRGLSLDVGLSAGVAVFPVNGRTQEALFKAADTALYEAKRREADAPWVMAGICQRELPCV